MPGSSRSDSEDSALSHITVTSPLGDAPDTLPVQKMSTSSVDAPTPHSTPPTSLDGSNAVDQDATKEGGRVRGARGRFSSSSSKLNMQGDIDGPTLSKRKARGSDTVTASTSRAVSGATLVEDGSHSDLKQEKLKKELEIDANFATPDETTQFEDEEGRSRRKSRRSQVGASTGHTISSAASSLGKRARDAIDSVKDKASAVTTRTTRAQTVAESTPKRRKSEASMTSRLFPNLKLDVKSEDKAAVPQASEEPAEVTKFTRPARLQKKYHEQGLYTGQVRSSNPNVKEKTNKKKKRESETTLAEEEKENSVLPLPMFSAYTRLTIEGYHEPYKLPYDILAPSKKEYKPKDWSNLRANKCAEGAETTWDSKDFQRLGVAYCKCKPKDDKGEGGCDSDCYNRHMSYECNETLCRLGANCGNRPFAELRFRSKNKNFFRPQPNAKEGPNMWGEGVEVFKTADRGDGVRAMRTFEPGQIVVEYCGEIITQETADKRMNEDYKDRKDYYLMEFHDGLIIDAGKRGSMCRFVNHSCEPNCRVEKWIVNGEPRMALFAGPYGIMSGEELTYDYNFELFSKDSSQICRCGAPSCRGILGPKPKDRKPNKLSKALSDAKSAVSGAARAVKRKAQQAFHNDENSEEETETKSKKRVKMESKPFVEKLTKQISSVYHDAVAPVDESAMQLQKESREERARRKAEQQKAKEEADRLLEATKGSDSDDLSEEEEVATPPKKSNSRRRVSSATLAVSDVPKESTTALKRTRSSPVKRVSGLKDRIVESAKSAVGATNAGASSALSPRVTSQTRLIGSSESSTTTEAKSMRQSRLSFGTGGFGFKTSPKKRMDSGNADATEGASNASKGPIVPERGSSLKAVSKNSTTLGQDLVRGLSQAATTAKLGVQGEKGARKAVRAVSGVAE